jgi:hypothetical protein
MNRAIAWILPRDPATLIADRFERDILRHWAAVVPVSPILDQNIPGDLLVAR